MKAHPHVSLAAVLLLTLSALAQQATPPAAEPAATEPAGEGMVTLNFPEDMDLRVLADYVGKRYGINFIYDEQIAGRKVTIKTTRPVPASSLMTLLESAMRMRGLMLVPTNVPNLVRIEVAKQLTTTTGAPLRVEDGLGPDRPSQAVTRVFELRHTTTQRVEQVLAPFLSTPTANVLSVPDQAMVIVTDFADNIAKLDAMVALVDRPARQVATRFVPVHHLDAASMAQKITQLQQGRAKARGAGSEQAAGLTIMPDERTNQLVLVGPESEVQRTAELVQSLDVPLGLQTKVYSFEVAGAEQVDRLVRDLIGELTAKRLYKATADRQSNVLIVTTTAEVHEQVEALRKAMDRPSPEAQSPVRFYKLENAKATDVLATLMTIEGEEGLAGVTIDGLSAKPLAEQAAYRGPTEADVNRAPSPQDDAAAAGNPPRPRQSVELRDARIMADEASNTIIVIARPSMHPVYEKLITRLDVRRPQVLVEATVVIIDTTDDFQLGVEISRSNSIDGGPDKTLNFTSFGLSEVDPNTGRLTLSPGLGFNGALISADIADIVIRALESDRRARVMSKPSVLINDNAIGTLASEAEEPFTTVTTSGVAGAVTTFGGYARAGTKITVEPQISEGEHLKLKYRVELSSFSDVTNVLLPPGRQTNALESEVTIPDGHVIVVGGLTRETYERSVDRVPLLGRIPIIEYLFSSRSTTKQKATLFVFLRAVILRSDKFEDLKVISGSAAEAALLPQDAPTSEPLELP